eukprot:SAG31_NODE_15220_length_764_cov_3.548872_1_plen_87_part_00
MLNINVFIYLYKNIVARMNANVLVLIYSTLLLLLMVIYTTPPLLFVALLPPNLNAAPILTRTQAPHQNPTVWGSQDKHFSMLSANS